MLISTAFSAVGWERAARTHTCLYIDGLEAQHTTKIRTSCYDNNRQFGNDINNEIEQCNGSRCSNSEGKEANSTERICKLGSARPTDRPTDSSCTCWSVVVGEQVANIWRSPSQQHSSRRSHQQRRRQLLVETYSRLQGMQPTQADGHTGIRFNDSTDGVCEAPDKDNAKLWADNAANVLKKKKTEKPTKARKKGVKEIGNCERQVYEQCKQLIGVHRLCGHINYSQACTHIRAYHIYYICMCVSRQCILLANLKVFPLPSIRKVRQLIIVIVAFSCWHILMLYIVFVLSWYV